MGRTRQSTEFLKQCIEDSVFILLKTKKFEDLDVTMVCKKADVGRTSFYRYFTGLEDVVLHFFIRAWSDWCDSHDVKVRDRFDLENGLTFFEYNLSIKERLSIVYKNNLEYIMLKSFEKIMTNGDNPHNYENRFYGYGLFALLKEWWIRDFKETPEEMRQIIIDIVN